MKGLIYRFEKAAWVCMCAGLLLVVVAITGACRPVKPAKQDAMLNEVDAFLASGERWRAVERSGASMSASMEVCEAAGTLHIGTVQGLQTMDVGIREFEVARVYTVLQMLAQIHGLKDKEAEYGKKAAEALQRSGAEQLSVPPGSEVDIRRISTARWEHAARSGETLENCQAAGEFHIRTVRGLQFVDPAMQAFEEAKVYTRLRKLARTQGVRNKEVEYEAKAVDALRRTGANSHAGPGMVDAMERKLDSN